MKRRTAVVTGASSGIGAACARAFAAQGARLLLAARRVELIEAAVSELLGAGAVEVRAERLDVRDAAAVGRLVNGLSGPWREIDVLVDNAGLSRGLDKLQEGSLSDWNEMIDTNVKGVLHVDRAVVPLMVARGRGTVVHLGSIAGRQVYPGGNVYCASKHAVRALTDGLRLDVLGSGVRVCTVDPGMVETEFSEVRFHGDRERAAAFYRGYTPLTPEDVAEAVAWVIERPPHVHVRDVVMMPVVQRNMMVFEPRRES